MLDHPYPAIHTAAIRTVGNILTGDNEQAERIISCGLLPHLKALLEHSKNYIRKEVLLSLSNIAAGSLDQIQAVIDAEIFPKLFSMLSPRNGEAVNVKDEIYYVCKNALQGGNGFQIQYLMDQGVIQQLCDALDVNSTVLTVLLDGLKALLSYGEQSNTLKEITETIEKSVGVENIKSLQYHTSEDIQQRALNLLETYWEMFKHQ